jgi:4-amino-4-deoxy-L-arabinose transferase-like glycosyltransferase
MLSTPPAPVLPPTIAQRTQPRLRIRPDWPLIGLVLVALGIRLWGITWQLPWLLHPVERQHVEVASEMLLNGDPNPHFFFNPTFAIYWLAGEFWVLGRLGMLLGLLTEPLALLRGPHISILFLVDRINSAVFGSLTLVLVSAIGATLLSRSVGLLAAAYLALNFLHVRNSHYGSNDIEATFVLTLSVYLVVRLWQRPTLRAYLLAGACGGLATSTKYSVGMFFAPILVAHVLAWRRSLLKPYTVGLLVAAGVASVAAYLATSPFTVLAWREFQKDFLEQAGNASAAHFGQAAEPVPLLYVLTLGQSLGWIQLILASVGIVGLAWRKLPSALLLGAFPFVYLLYLAPNEVFWVRLAIPLLPFACLFAAGGTWLLVSALVAERRHAPALLALGAVALVQPAVTSVWHNVLITREDTRVLASRWALEHLAGKGRIAYDDYSVSFPLDNWPAGKDSEITTEERVHRRSLDYYRRRGYHYLITSSFIQGRYFVPTTELWADRIRDTRDLVWPAERDRSRQLEAQITPLAIFAPGVGGTEVPFNLDDIHTPFWSLSALERPGPTIKIYALD